MRPMVYDAGHFLAFLSIIASIASAAPFISDSTAPTSPSITPAASVVKRDIQSICGFWIFSTAPEQGIWSYYCDYGISCAIDTYVTPNIVFCAIQDFTPYTTFYSYGSWPERGCGYQEACCPSALPKIRTHIYDQGASVFFACAESDINEEDGSRYVSTQIGESSAYLAPFTTVDAVSKTSLTPAAISSIVTPTSPPSATHSTNSTPSPSEPITTSGHSATTSAASSSTRPVNISSSSSSVPSQSSNRLNTGAEVGSILGAVFGAVAILVAIYYGRRELRHRREKGGDPRDPQNAQNGFHHGDSRAPHRSGGSYELENRRGL